jgi:2,3-bisphosphoglycerate-independent phosphoglycerate mutase
VNSQPKFVMVIPDGAADSNRELGCSPLQAAQIPNMDFLAREGVCGLVQTLYPDLPRESMVAQLGILGWDPRVYYPFGRASAELLACEGIQLAPGDVAFRANLVRMAGNRLESYNACFIESEEAVVLIERIRSVLTNKFPEFELHHNSDFRNTLIVRNASVDPRDLICPEPHESHGRQFAIGRLISARTLSAENLAARINEYLLAAAALIEDESANALFPWSASRAFQLCPFSESTGFPNRVGIVGFMDFLLGIAKAGGVNFFRVGNGRPGTNYEAKGRKIIELLERGFSLVVCHINAPDEASHMGDLPGKVAALEQIDRFVVAPVIRYFERHTEELGGIIILPDHYSNITPELGGGRRGDIHSLHPVPFALWNNRDRDSSAEFSEDGAARGIYARPFVHHLSILPLLLHLRNAGLANA